MNELNHKYDEAILKANECITKQKQIDKELDDILAGLKGELYRTFLISQIKVELKTKL